MGRSLDQFLIQLGNQETISSEDISMLCRLVFGAESLQARQAETIISLNHKLGNQNPKWADFYLGALTEYILNDRAPESVITDEKAAWLMARLSREGRVENVLDLHLLINVLMNASGCAPLLKQFVIHQVREAIVNGSGILGRARQAECGYVLASDVELLRHIMLACGGTDGEHMTREEADALIEINQAVSAQDNHRDWDDFFIHALSNYFMSLATRKTPDRDIALRREVFLKGTPNLKILSFANGLGPANLQNQTHNKTGLSLAKRGLMKLLKRSDEISDEKTQRHWQDEAMMNPAEMLNPEDVDWLRERFNLEGDYTRAEALLLSWVKENCPPLYSSIMPYLRAA